MRIVAFLACLTVCYAQPPGFRGAGPGGPPVIDAIVEYLGLSDAQVSAFEAIRETARTAAQPILEQVRTKMAALREATQNNDATTAGRLQVEIAALREQIAGIQESARTQASGVLNASQRTKLDALVSAAELFEEARQAAGLGLIEVEGGPGGRGLGPGLGPR